LSKDDVLHAFNTFVRPVSSKESRKKFSVHILSQQVQEVAPDTAESKVVTDGSEHLFKASLACYPAAVPVEYRDGVLERLPRSAL